MTVVISDEVKESLVPHQKSGNIIFTVSTSPTAPDANTASPDGVRKFLSLRHPVTPYSSETLSTSPNTSSPPYNSSLAPLSFDSNTSSTSTPGSSFYTLSSDSSSADHLSIELAFRRVHAPGCSHREPNIEEGQADYPIWAPIGP